MNTEEFKAKQKYELGLNNESPFAVLVLILASLPST